jgi:hypothetical protein
MPLFSKKSEGPEHVGTCFDGQEMRIEGVNVWDYKWELKETMIKVKDPQYHNVLNFALWSITVDGREIEFIAGEFSNGVWGFYRPVKA